MILALPFACSCQIMSRKTNKKSIQHQSRMQLKCFLGAISLCKQIAYHLSVGCDPHPKEESSLLRMGVRNAQENNLFADVSTGFMNDDSLPYLSSKVQFRWYDNAESVLSHWGGSCFSGGVLLFPHYCNAAPEALCQSCCAAACECWG